MAFTSGVADMCNRNRCWCAFKAGDKVECIYPTGPLRSGETYYVADCNKGFVRTKEVLGCYDSNRFRKVEPKMEIGKEYHYKGASTVALCVGFDGEFALMRYPNKHYPKYSNEEFLYKRRKGEIGPNAWAEYKGPVIMEVYTHIEPSGNICGWYHKPNLGLNLMATFTDGVLTNAKVLK